MENLNMKNYIDNLKHTPTNQLKSVKGNEFISGLGDKYGAEKVKETIIWLTDPSFQKSYAGMKSFQERIFKAIVNDATLSPGRSKIS